MRTLENLNYFGQFETINNSKMTNSRSFLESWNQNPRITRDDFKKWHFLSLRPNLSSVTKIKWNRCPICQNWQKIGQFQAISRVPENSWKFPGMMKFLNSVLKIKFLDINWVGFIPYMLKSVKTSQFQGTSGILESWIPGSRNHNISPNVRKINTNIL